MFLRFADRPSDSPYIERVWRGRSDGGGPFLSVAAGHLELVVTRLADFTMVTLRGPETRATTIECPRRRVGGDPLSARRAHAVASDPLGGRSPRRESAGVDRRIVRAPGLSLAAPGPGECGRLRRPARSVRRDRAGRRGCGSDTRRRTTAHDPIDPAALPAHHGYDARAVPPDRTGPLRDQPATRWGVHPGRRPRGRILRPGPSHPVAQTPHRRDTGERHAAEQAAVVSVQNRLTCAGLICRQSFSSRRRVVRVEPFVYFQGRCEEALEFYRVAIGAEATVLARFGDNVGHAELRIGDTVVLASDGQGAGKPEFTGFSLSLTVSDDAEAERLFAALADGGTVQVQMAPTPFASRLGLVADRFGVPWMVVSQNATG